VNKKWLLIGVVAGIALLAVLARIPNDKVRSIVAKIVGA
jgi:hypothetical protein